MMEEYILPPPLDFRLTRNDPYMMYFFQFHASLDKKDVSNIWQNLYPESNTSGGKARYSCVDRTFQGRDGDFKDTSYVSHYLDTVSLTGEYMSPAGKGRRGEKSFSPYDLFSPRETDNKTRWLIFKVKERGKTNLEEIRKASLDSRVSNIEKFEYIREGKSSKSSETLDIEAISNRPGLENTLQYNWPYDFFSLVELIKMEAKVDSYTYKKEE